MQLQVFTDGGSRGNPGDAAIGGIVLDAKNNLLYEFSKFIGTATNNEAEYFALYHALEWLLDYEKSVKITHTMFNLDSKLVVEQINQNWKIKEPRMRTLAGKCWELIEKLTCETKFIHVKREKNYQADLLVNQALDSHQL
jgi:ribonuclease HI